MLKSAPRSCLFTDTKAAVPSLGDARAFEAGHRGSEPAVQRAGLSFSSAMAVSSVPMMRSSSSSVSLVTSVTAT